MVGVYCILGYELDAAAAKCVDGSCPGIGSVFEYETRYEVDEDKKDTATCLSGYDIPFSS
jgi:hypothetical protein